MANLPTLAQKCAELHPYVAPVVSSGLSYTTGFICSGVSLVIGFITGWYIKGRGMTGVKIDMDNVKNDISILKAKVDAQVS